MISSLKLKSMFLKREWVVLLVLKSLLMGLNISNLGYENTAPEIMAWGTCVVTSEDSIHMQQAVQMKPAHKYILVQRLAQSFHAVLLSKLNIIKPPFAKQIR